MKKQIPPDDRIDQRTAEWRVLTIADLELRAYEQALEPKKLVTIGGGHFDPYLRQFAAASNTAVSWFHQHLGKDQ